MPKCLQELCQFWSGDGNVCPCAVLDVQLKACGVEHQHDFVECQRPADHDGQHQGIGEDGGLYQWW